MAGNQAGLSRSKLINQLIRQRAAILYLLAEHLASGPSFLEQGEVQEAITDDYMIQATTDVEKFLTGRFP